MPNPRFDLSNTSQSSRSKKVHHLTKKKHDKRKNRIHTYICEFCGSNFLIERHYHEHKAQEHVQDQFLYNCGYCAEVMTLAELEGHIRKYHVQLAFCCTHCDLTFRSRACLDIHIATHEGIEIPEPSATVQVKCVIINPVKFVDENKMEEVSVT